MSERRKVLPIIKGVVGAATPHYVRTNDVAEELRIHAERGTSVQLSGADLRYVVSCLEALPGREPLAADASEKTWTIRVCPECDRFYDAKHSRCYCRCGAWVNLAVLEDVEVVPRATLAERERELSECKRSNAECVEALRAGDELAESIKRHRPKEIDRPNHLREALARWEALRNE